MSITLLISGRGSNMQAILDAGLPVSAVISNRPEAAGLALAAGAALNGTFHLIDPHTAATIGMIAAALGITLQHKLPPAPPRWHSKHFGP